MFCLFQWQDIVSIVVQKQPAHARKQRENVYKARVPLYIASRERAPTSKSDRCAVDGEVEQNFVNPLSFSDLTKQV